MKLEQLTAPSLRDLFVKTIQDAIISGELKIGEVLPTEREFAEQMNISRSVVNSGLNELQNRGFIEIKPRKGAVVADYIYTGNINTLTALMEYKGIWNVFPVEEPKDHNFYIGEEVDPEEYKAYILKLGNFIAALDK